MASIITLTTDFGLADHYVAAMKGIILGINPEAVIVDLTHDVAPQQVVQAVYLTGSAWPHFPRDAIHVAVVDPGVGTHRRALLLEAPTGSHVGPDNGVLSAALPDEARRTVPSDNPEDISLPEGYRAFQIAEPRFIRIPVSDTFHGRDVFAPVAAHLSLGVPPEDFGEEVSSMLALPPIRAPRRPDGVLAARVIHVDRFGNLLTDALAQDLPTAGFRVEISGRTVTGPVRTYADAQGLVAIVGSSGYLEVAEPGGSAAAVLGVGSGEPLLVRADR